MSIVNTRDKTVCTKVVYYGPGLGGKTSSLSAVHGALDPANQSRLVTLKTDEERTLFFDFLPLDLGLVGGYRARIQAFTVPGQVKYNLTRRYVLMGADAVVFVADSQTSRLAENVESMVNLGDNLATNGLDINEIPLVIQYNKRDLDGLTPIQALRDKLNFRAAPDFATSATSGAGIVDAFVCAVRAMVERVARKYQLGSTETEIGEAIERSLFDRAGPRRVLPKEPAPVPDV